MTNLQAVYIGRRVLTSGKIGCSFITPELLSDVIAINEKRDFIKLHPSELTDAIDRQASMFSLKRTPLSIGGIYEAHQIDENGKVSSISNNPKWISANNENFADLVIAWKMADQSAVNSLAIKRLETKTETDREFAKALDVIKSRYNKIMPGDRVAFQVWFIRELSRR